MNPETIERLLQRLAEGESLKKAAKAEGVSFQSVLRLREKDKEFADHYTRARLIGYERLAEELLEISDDGSNDTYMDDEGNIKNNPEIVARSRLRVDTRKWMLAKMLPKIYGDKIDHNISGGFTVTLNNSENEL